MADTKKFFITADLRPTYYDDFHCLAGDCLYTCCRGWRITFDKKDYLSLKHQKCSPNLSSRMEHSLQRIRKRNAIADHYAEIRLSEDNVCPLQREDGLCSLQVENGPQALPFVCQTFPRKEIYNYSSYFERSLSLGCEGVVALLWNLPEGIDFRSDPLPPEFCKILKPRDKGHLIPYFQDIRSIFIDYLQDRRFPLPSRILMIGLAIQELMSARDVPHWLAYAQALPERPYIAQSLKIENSENMLRMFLANNLKLLIKTQSSDPETIKIKTELLHEMGIQVSSDGSLLNIDSTAYLTARENYSKIFSGCDYFMENIMVTLFFHMNLPALDTLENLWKSYVNFCNLYSFYRFITTLGCRDGVDDKKAELFLLTAVTSRTMLHNNLHQTRPINELFEHDSATLAHMAVLLSD